MNFSRNCFFECVQGVQKVGGRYKIFDTCVAMKNRCYTRTNILNRKRQVTRRPDSPGCTESQKLPANLVATAGLLYGMNKLADYADCGCIC
jgi:hypothetical protein